MRVVLGRRTDIFRILRKIALIGAVIFTTSTRAAPIYQNGTFALQGGRAVTEGHAIFEPIGAEPLNQHIAIWMTPQGKSMPIRDYSVEMTKKLHVVIVDSELSTFIHIHPNLGADGIFTIDGRLPRAGTYYVYADGVPSGGDHQVFRFVLRIGKGTASHTELVPTGRELTVGPYTVDLSKARLTAQTVDALEVEISKNGAPAKDLHPYLGAPGHAVFLNAHDLTYLHVHPVPEDTGMKGMDMSGMKMSALAMDLPDSDSLPSTMILHASVYEPGIYKMWLQFRGGSDLYVAAFVLRAE